MQVTSKNYDAFSSAWLDIRQVLDQSGAGTEAKIQALLRHAAALCVSTYPNADDWIAAQQFRKDMEHERVGQNRVGK